MFSIFPVAFLKAFFLEPRLERPVSPITGSGNEKPVYDVFTFPRFQNVSKLPKFEFLSAKCSCSGLSGVEFRLLSVVHLVSFKHHQEPKTQSAHLM